MENYLQFPNLFDERKLSGFGSHTRGIDIKGVTHSAITITTMACNEKGTNVFVK